MSTSGINSSPRPQPKWMTIVGWLLTILPSLMLLMGGYMNLSRSQMAIDGLKQYGYPESSAFLLGVVVLISTLLYLVPQTCVLGAILLTGYLGGAVATHVRASEPFIIAVVFGVVIWLGLFFRDARLRRLMPFRSK